MKKCSTCNEEKPISDFGVRNASADGMSAQCKKCQSIYDKNRSALPHRVIARKKYAKTEQGKAAGGRAKKRWADKNAIKRGADVVVGNAVRDGRIKKPADCSECGDVPNVMHGHHDDYAAPLVVRWLCPGCHALWHRDNGQGVNG